MNERASGRAAGAESSVPLPELRISDGELERRRRRVLERVSALGGDAFVSFAATAIYYLTNFASSPTERPTALVLAGDGTASLFVPMLKLAHAEAVARVDGIGSFPEYPGERHPMVALAEWLEDLGLGQATIVAEQAGYASAQGYAGPPLAEVLPGAKVKIDGRLTERLRMVKSAEEIAMLRECYRWVHVAHRRLQERCRAGARELDISAEASRAATAETIAGLAETYTVRRPIKAYVNFGAGGGQVGKDAAAHYSEDPNPTLEPGDVLVTFAQTQIARYLSELERTLFVGEPSREQALLFAQMVELQDAALAAIRPGTTGAAVDAEVRRLFDAKALWPYWHHHSGHSIGLLDHEAPFLDIGDRTVIEPGMVFTVEPGLYAAGVGAFRHSDSVLITERGVERLTDYPRDLESLICR